MENEIRIIPKKTKILIAVLVILISVIFAILTYLKDLRMEEILNSLGYKNITNIQVINKMSVENKETRKNGTLYKVLFDNKDTKEECIGFVHKDSEGQYYDDFDCKKSE
ncbi:hypothetical protein CPU12_08525 [Malaciobacter molluscorum LMG 25693]|uniref:DUF3139 domain-containing protein n=1 Tax=Malaciobacter molluscorum LMG 25693 TaxID=870501 RepID=A0A2G1DH40_9BACT|nr:hypothetical protein [Malaciobacter molluscorum]AXX93390.1 hypothetical protein AMOL_2448 [Malaciobacter molluscorum LMG 25693]PHO17793.1 hypothetical protein CPU12_08525 [Malaciobacter molluscorum LMG 25693]RXJ95091.1 hypothetical protein CRV00_04865 [Malaciobacter molluscorum]